MLINPFTPSEIASSPDDFFGRDEELRTLERSLVQGSVAIEGPIGIGKSSLLARGRLLMEGFDSENRAHSVIAVADRGIETIEQAARLLLEAFVRVDEQQSRVSLKLGSVFEFESKEVTAYFKEGRHLAVLKGILEREYAERRAQSRDMLILAIDEADKAPGPLAQLVRSLVTHTQQQGVERVRFVLAGVRPFFQRMVDEDQGISRFFYRVIALNPMSADEADDLIVTKLSRAIDAAAALGISITIDPDIVERMVALAGGHPHILQLLGSHLIEHEDEDPDGRLDSKDLVNSLRRICYDDRANVYSSTLHYIELNGKAEALKTLLGMSTEAPRHIVSAGFPTRIDREMARQIVNQTAIQWLVDHNVLSVHSAQHYGLVDEFLRIRLVFDELEAGDTAEVEWSLADQAALPGWGDDVDTLLDENEHDR